MTKLYARRWSSFRRVSKSRRCRITRRAGVYSQYRDYDASFLKMRQLLGMQDCHLPRQKQGLLLFVVQAHLSLLLKAWESKEPKLYPLLTGLHVSYPASNNPFPLHQKKQSGCISHELIYSWKQGIDVVCIRILFILFLYLHFISSGVCGWC